MKIHKRYSLKSLEQNLEDDIGLIFNTPSGLTDLSDVKIVGASVDTIRQLVSGTIKPEILRKIESMVDQKQDVFYLVDFSGKGHTCYAFSKIGRASGYRFMLQNAELGIIILFGKFHGQLDTETERSHLKIEFSPHFISQHSASQIHDFIFNKTNGIAEYFLDSPKPAACEVHLACDYQGFQLPPDFVQNFKTYTRTLKTYDGISTLDLSDISESITTYGRDDKKNYTIGRRTAVQICAYDKTVEAIKSDKIDYMQHEWGVYTLGDYDNTVNVRRIELRLHHSVVREFGLSRGEEWQSYKEVAKHLNSIWQYGLSRNWLKLKGKTTDYIHPFWQLLIHDVKFYDCASPVKLARKKKGKYRPHEPQPNCGYGQHD